jgi:hypothetical protein
MVASAYQKQWYTGHSENHERYEDCSPLEKKWIDGRIRGDLCGDMTQTEWESLDRFSRCCWYWYYVNTVIEKDLRKYACERFFFLQLENVEMELTNLISWMGLKADTIPSVKQHNIAKRVPYHWTEWSTEQHNSFDFWCGNLMDSFYPTWRIYTSPLSRTFVMPAINGLKQKIDKTTQQLQTQKQKNQEYSIILQQLKEQLENLMIENENLNHQLNQVQSSRSWKVTAPLRKLAQLLKRFN